MHKVTRVSSLVVVGSLLAVLAMTSCYAQQFKAGQKVMVRDAHSRFGGGMIPATVTGEGYGGKVKVHYDKPGIPWQYADEDVPPDWITGTTGSADTGNTTAPQPVDAQPPVKVQPPTQGAWNPPPRGKVMPGDMNPNSALGRKGTTPAGRKDFFVHSPPGDELPLGRWNLRVGGQFFKAGETSTTTTYEYGKPEQASIVTINSNGSWSKNDHGKVTQGRWDNIGSNVIRLEDYGGAGDDWTVSAWKGEINIKSQVGELEWGRRF